MAFLEKIIKQSPWVMDGGKIAEDIHLKKLADFPLVYRHDVFLNYTFQDGVYVLTGSYQIGKSTLLKLLIQSKLTESTKENYLYFNCDLLDTKQEVVELVETYLENFPSSERRYVLLDEVTSVKDSFIAVKYLVDSGLSENITYILTGSNTINVKKTGEYLPGRRGKGIDFHFKPLSFKAFLQLLYPSVKIDLNLASKEKDFIALNKKVNLEAALEKYLRTGGFPRVINEMHLNNQISDDIYLIYRSWITSEIAKSDKKEHLAKCILERCLASLSSEVSYSAFVQETGVGSHNTVYDYIDFFSNVYVLSQIYHYDIHQKRVAFRKNKKIYFSAPFVYATIEAWLSGKPIQDFDYLKNPIFMSQVVENLEYLRLTDFFEDVYFFKNQMEIDFVCDKYLVEVKYQSKIIPNDYQFLAKHTGQKILVTKNTYQQTKEVLLLPLAYFLVSDLALKND